MKNESALNCCNNTSCECTPKGKKKLFIDFLYLDLNTCERCKGTDNNLLMAVEEVKEILKAANYETEVNKIKIDSKETAIKYKFVSSPTIRINGKDIDITGKESDCKECGDICGDSVDCRVWTYEEEVYTEAPKAMIINAILKEVYGNKDEDMKTIEKPYIFPKNLEKFFLSNIK